MSRQLTPNGLKRKIRIQEILVGRLTNRLVTCPIEQFDVVNKELIKEQKNLLALRETKCHTLKP